jgi:hypothetical protein
MKSQAALLVLVPILACSALAAPPWAEILAPAQSPARAAVAGSVVWRSDLVAALDEARRTNRPLFVTFRCLPCKQCADFDKEVLEGGSALDPWLSQFITVRLTDARAMDLRVFPVEGFQDLDLSWWGWFLSPLSEVYGVYGGRDEVSDATRISVASLAKTMQRVLAHHADPRSASWKIDGPVSDLTAPQRTPEQLPGFAAWNKQTPPEALQHKGANCLHCHMVADILRTPAVAAKTFDKQRDTQIWPLPENVGVTVERDDGLLVKAVAAGSAAEKAGLRAGDVLAAAGGRRLFSQADFRAALHRGPAGAGALEVWWLRDGQPLHGELTVADGWRKTVLDWRMSISQGVISIGPGFFPLKVPDAKRQQLGIAADAMAVQPFVGKDSRSFAMQAGLRNNHVITAVDGQSPNVVGRGFLVWFRMQHEPGDQVALTTRGPDGKEQVITYELRGRED